MYIGPIEEASGLAVVSAIPLSAEWQESDSTAAVLKSACSEGQQTTDNKPLNETQVYWRKKITRVVWAC